MFQVKHNLSSFNLNCCLHMLLNVVFVQQTAFKKYFCASKTETVTDRLKRSAGMKHVSLVLNVWRTCFVIVLIRLCFIY